MRSNLFKSLAIIMGMMMSFSFVSCGDDDDNDEPEPGDQKEVAYYDVKYMTDLHDDWFDFFDVSITYVGTAGTEVTEPLERNTSFTENIEANVAPNSISFKIHVTPKASHPAIDVDKVYDFNGEAQLFVQAYLKDKTKGNFSGNLIPSSTIGVKVKGDKVEQFLERHTNVYIFDSTVKL